MPNQQTNHLKQGDALGASEAPVLSDVDHLLSYSFTTARAEVATRPLPLRPVPPETPQHSISCFPT